MLFYFHNFNFKKSKSLLKIFVIYFIVCFCFLFLPVLHECEISVEENWIDFVSRSEEPVNLSRFFESLQEQLVIGLNLTIIKF